MKVTNECRKDVVFSIAHEYSNQPWHHHHLRPRGEFTFPVRDVDMDAMTFTIGCGTLYTGEAKEISMSNLHDFREKLELAQDKSRSKEVKKLIQDVLNGLGY